MDRELTFPTAPDFAAAPGGMPPDAPLDMQAQDLSYTSSNRLKGALDSSILFSRVVLINVTVAITAYGTYEMLQVVRFSSMTLLQGMMMLFFTISLAWIAFSTGSVVAGWSKRREPIPPDDAPAGLSALVMPIYNEDPQRTMTALQAMAEALKDLGVNGSFEIVVLSDSTNADAWIRETVAIDRLRAALGGTMALWYRRRWHNTARKSGNIEEFIRRWGARFDHMIVLDADSLIDARTLLRLAQTMQADPSLGILQTAPQLIGASTFFGRLQQFAACVYGPVITRGLAAWSGSTGNYWGHNAIIRVKAFAANCGLPELAGRKPFGGHVLSHDFVEAALMRRGGWKVCMATQLAGSWEESPPSLIDIAVRDRRWAQGNLQHLKIIGASGLSFTSRLHLGIGIMSYLSAPLWLLLLGIGFALALQAHLIRPEYFSHDFQLFPTWPIFNAELMTALFWFSMVVLLTPKLLGMLSGMFSRRIRKGGGGMIGVMASVLVEAILSALYAPILMLIQSRHVFEVFLGRDSGWKTQRRDGGASTWAEAWQFHRRHMAISCVMAVIVWFLSPELFIWVSPALLGLFLSVPLSRLSGSRSIGRALALVGLLRTPEEMHPPALVSRRLELLNEAPPLPDDGLHFLARNREARLAHIHGNLPRPADPRGRPDPHAFTAEQKLVDARALEEALAWLTPIERVEVAASARMLAQLAALPEAQRPAYFF